MRSIHLKFVAAILSVIALCSITIGSIGLSFLWKQSQQDATAYLDVLSDLTTERLNRTFADVEQSTGILAARCLYGLQELGTLPNEALASDLVEDIRPVVTSITEATYGVSATYIRFAMELCGPTSGIMISLADNGTYYETPVTDLSAYKDHSDGNVNWYYAPQEKGAPLWLAPYQADNTHRTTISYIVPLYYQDTFIGICGIDVPFSFVQDTIRNTTFAHNGTAALVQSDENDYRLLENRNLLTVQRQLNNGMMLALSIPNAELLEGVTHATIQFILGTVLVITASILGGLLVSRSITKPLSKLSKNALEIASGNLDADLTVSTKDEIGSLSTSLSNMVAVMREQLNAISGLAYRDALTDARNTMGYKAARESLDAAIRSGDAPEFALMVFDVNSLKLINDGYGHGAGDKYLVNACRMISTSFPQCPIFRIGGDEFLVIIQGEAYKDRHRLASEFSGRMTQARKTATTPWEQISIAHGIASYKAGRDTCVGDVFYRADAAMYACKEDMKQMMAGETDAFSPRA